MPWSVLLLFGLCLSGSGEGVAGDPALQRLEFLLDRFEAKPLTVASCAAGLGEGWEEAWRFVRRRIAYLPYEGIVRGPEGVLLSREGNSLERAMLLARLLQEKGYTVRLCSASFPEAASPALQEGEKPAGGKDRPPEAGLASLARDLGYPEGVLEAYAGQRRFEEESRRALLRSRTRARLRTLEKVLPRITPPRGRELTCWWVQAAASGDAWVDLDPTLAAEPGKAPAEAEETLDPDELPHELTASLEVAVFLEQGDARAELLSFRDSLPALALSPLSLAFVPADPALEPDPEKNWAAYRKRERFLCTARAGGRVLLGNSFDLEGRVYRGSGDGRIEAARRMGRGLAGLFGGGGGGEEGASWSLVLEGKVTGPAGDRSFRRRLVKAGKNPDASRVALLSSFSYVVIPGPVTGGFFVHAALRGLWEKRAFLDRLPVEDPKKLLEAVPSYPAELFAFAQALRPLRGEFLPGASFPFLLVGYEVRFTGEPGGEVRIRRGYDIVDCPLAVTGPAPGLGLRFGTALTELERILLERFCPRPLLSPSGLFFQARARGTAIRVVKKEEDLPDLPPAARAVLVEALERGRVLAVPEVPVEWNGRDRVPVFEMDPASGLCLGRLGRRGQAVTEYLEKIDFIMNLVDAIDAYSKMMQCMTAAVIAPLAGKSRAEARRDFARCATEWALGRLFTGVKGFFDIDPDPENIAVGAVVGGVPGSPFGGFTGSVSKGVAEYLFGK